MNILLVEDSQADANIMSDFLKEEGHCPVINSVRDGQEALDYVFKSGKFSDAATPDMIIMDLALPRLGGYEVLKALKESSFAHIPVVVLTTSNNPVDFRSCKRLGAAQFFSKPYNLQGYVDMVEQLLQEDFYQAASRKAS